MGAVKRIYRALYSRSPRPVKGALTKLVATLPGKPSVGQCDIHREERFPDGYKAAFVMSADFEMAWAWRYAKCDADHEEMGLLERRNLPVFLDHFEKYDVPITWATVGHLFLNGCERVEGVPHPELSRIPHFTNRVWNFFEGDWYDLDPCSSVEDAPAWYAPDLIQAIQASPVSHEIACHTFSHLDCTDAHCPPEVFEDEIKACIKAAEPFGVELKSMVFPGGTNGNYSLLKKYGFTNYRLSGPHDLFYPWKDDNGLWALPSSSSIDDYGFGWSPEYYRKYYTRYIEKAIESGTVCHLWFHPSVNAFCLNEIFPQVLSAVRERAAAGDLWVTTMAELTDYCERKHG